MTYNLETAKSSSNKFYMMRIEGVRALSYDNCEMLGAYSGYEVLRCFVPTALPKSLKRYNSATSFDSFTRVYTKTFPINPSVPSDGADTYYFDDLTGELIFYSSNLGSLTCFEFNLFFTEDIYLRAKSDVTSGDEVFWSPRILGSPSFGYSQENIISGLLSISNSSVNLKNNDKYFNKFLSESFGYNNREVKIWECINSTENSEVAFTGTIKQVTLNDSECSFSFNDVLDRLDVEVYGENPSPLILRNLGYTVQDQKGEIPVTYLYCKISPYKLKRLNVGLQNTVEVLDPENMLEAKCVSYNASKTTSTNRTWHCLFGPDTVATKTFSVTSTSGVLFIGDVEYQIIDFTAPVGKSGVDFFAKGDTVQIGSYYCQIHEVGSSSIRIWPKNTLLTSGMTMTRLKVPAVIVSAGGLDYYCRAGRDFTCQIGSAGDLQIVFVNNFEATVGVATLDPDTMRVSFRCWYDDFNDIASEQLKRILGMANLPVASSFYPTTNGAENYDPEICLTIPEIGSQSWPDAKSLIQQVLTSSFMFLYFDRNGELRAKSFLQPIDQDIEDIVNESGFNPFEEINQENSNDYSVSFDFYDTYGGVRSENKAHPNVDDGIFINNRTVGYSVMNSTNKVFVHNNILSYRDSADLSFIYTLIQDLICTRKAKYSMKVHSVHFPMYLGDDVKLSRPIILGESSSALIRLISIAKRQNDADESYLDLKRIPI